MEDGVWRTVQNSAFCRSRREHSNAYLLAKFGFDTAENEPCKVCPLFAYRSPRYPGPPPARLEEASLHPGDQLGLRAQTAVGRCPLLRRRHGEACQHRCLFDPGGVLRGRQAHQISEGSFSAVMTKGLSL